MLRAIGRLRDGATVAQAQADLDAIARRLEATYPEDATWRIRLLPYRDVIIGDSGNVLIILLGAVGLVVRELHLSGELQIGESRIGHAELARLSTLQRQAGSRG